jgi:predicted GNAT family acetyltransferase
MAEVTDVPEERRYVVTVDGARAGFLDYLVQGDVFVARHVEVDPSYAGQGLGSVLVSQVLVDVRTSGRRLRPACPFVSHYLREHPEFADLVVGATAPAEEDS